MNYSHPNEEDADDKWNQPETDSKHYVTFDTYTVLLKINSLGIIVLNILRITPITYILKIDSLSFMNYFIYISVLFWTKVCHH